MWGAQQIQRRRRTAFVRSDLRLCSVPAGRSVRAPQLPGPVDGWRDAQYLPAMLVLLSPSKSQRFPSDRSPSRVEPTVPRMLDAAAAVVAALRGLGRDELARRLKLSDAVADDVVAKYQAWTGDPSPAAGAPAILAYSGETYRGLDAAGLTADVARYAQQRLRILSALYGVLRPFDLIEPYRLDFAARLQVAGTRSLYGYWRDLNTAVLAGDLEATGSRAVVNLASTEFARAVDLSALGVRVITPAFRQKREGELRNVTVFSKQARGRMARWIMEEQPATPEQLAGFNADGYTYQPDLSIGDEPVFVR